MNKLLKTLIVLAVVAQLAVACGAQAPQATQEPLATQAPQVVENTTEQKLLGSWRVAVTTPTQGAFSALLTFTAGGGLIADQPSDNPLETSGHGNWISQASGEIAYTFLAFRGSGTIKVAGTLKYDPDKDSWSGPFKIEGTSNGQLEFSDKGKFTLTRIAVEAIE